MSLDLNDLLRDWPHEPGQVQVRKIIGSDGRHKVQLRIDLGLIQMEITGRPDGKRPHGDESLLLHHQKLAREAEGRGDTYTLSPEECAELQQEGIQYYHRYISLYQLGDYEGVMRDTERNIELFDFVTQHVEREDIVLSFEQFRPYVIMMHTRAKASIELDRKNFGAAVELIEAGRDRITEFLEKLGNPELLANNAEIAFLDEWIEEIKSQRPVSKLETMQREMEKAIAHEAYERAAELRDAIKNIERKQ